LPWRSIVQFGFTHHECVRGCHTELWTIEVLSRQVWKSRQLKFFVHGLDDDIATQLDDFVSAEVDHQDRNYHICDQGVR
jgi:hypothetical protein